MEEAALFLIVQNDDKLAALAGFIVLGFMTLGTLFLAVDYILSKARSK